jgi:hypothetical protein
LESNSRRITDASQLQNSKTQEIYDTDRNVTVLSNGKQTVTLEQVKQAYDKAQSTEVNASTTTAQLDANGNVISKRGTSSDTTTDADVSVDTEINRATIRNKDGSALNLTSVKEKGNTSILTNIESTDAAGRVTQRQVERDITTERELSSASKIAVDATKDGGKSFDLSTVEVDLRTSLDITHNGANHTTLATDVAIGKKLNGNISYTPRADAASVNAPSARVNVNFGTYTGLASGFQLESGEVNFNLDFQSAQLTEQSTTKEVDAASGGTRVVSERETQSGQLTDASLSGKLRSSVAEDGSRVIDVVASYRKAGAKFVSEGGDSPDLAKSEEDTEVEITGRFVISGDGTAKRIESSFDVSRVTKSEAEGNSEAAVKQALAQNDPLRNLFGLDRGNVRFNLGFASLNFSVYA